MNKLIVFLTITVLASSCYGQKETIKEDTLTVWEFKMISQGKNKPDFNPSKDSLNYIPILLHKGYELKEIQKYYDWTQEELKTRVDLLLKANFIKNHSDNEMTASLMVISEDEGKEISAYLKPITNDITKAIERNLDSIKFKTKKIECLSGFDFKDISLLILSNVLLDNGQINNVEKEYLGKERPNRNDKNYYASYQEKSKNSSYEALGIYGNQVEMKKGFALCRYGNQRYLPDVIELNKKIEERYSNISERERFEYPIITSKCNEGVRKLAAFFKPKLLSILNHHTSMIKEIYRNSTYKKEISYEEYFIWAYHILYTDITNELISKGHIVIPKEKIVFYIFQP